MKTEAPFQLDFTLEGKAARVTEHDGAVYIEGYAAEFDLDRQDEAFEPGAFEAGMKAFMNSNPVLLYHHKYDKALGQIESFEHRPDGLYVKARVDEAEPGTELADVVRKIKTGTIRGFSVGGRFKRRMGTDGRPRIHTADIAEISVTPFPINPRTLFAVAGKAFGDEDEMKLDQLAQRLADVADRFEELEGKAASAKKRAEAKYTFPGTDKYPISNCQDVRNAVSRSGSSTEDKSKVRAYIKRAAKALGCESAIPDDWS